MRERGHTDTHSQLLKLPLRCTFPPDISIYHQHFRIQFQPFALVLLFCIHQGTQLLIVLQISHTTHSGFPSLFHIHELKCYIIWNKFPATLWFYLSNFSAVLANVLVAADRKAHFFLPSCMGKWTPQAHFSGLFAAEMICKIKRTKVDNITLKTAVELKVKAAPANVLWPLYSSKSITILERSYVSVEAAVSVSRIGLIENYNGRLGLSVRPVFRKLGLKLGHLEILTQMNNCFCCN